MVRHNEVVYMTGLHTLRIGVDACVPTTVEAAFSRARVARTVDSGRVGAARRP